MTLCKDCIYWKIGLQGARKQGGFGECASPKWKYGYSSKPIENDEIQVEDDEGWGCYTGPLFGCIHGTTQATEEQE